MTNLTEHFTLEELSNSDSALRKGADNSPNVQEVTNLVRLCVDILEPVRTLLDAPLHINSGFRSPLVNVLVGGARDSAHTYGRAADFVPKDVNLLVAFDEIRKSDLPYDKVILECNAWIHIQVAPDGCAPRRKAFTAAGGPGTWTYQEVV